MMFDAILAVLEFESGFETGLKNGFYSFVVSNALLLPLCQTGVSQDLSCICTSDSVYTVAVHFTCDG